MDKFEKWTLIENELRQAYKLLPTNLKQSDFGYKEEDFLEYLDHNELRLAMEELDGIVEDNPPPCEEFWQHLASAAHLMGSKKEQIYSEYLSAT
jgi:hypothetical protein